MQRSKSEHLQFFILFIIATLSMIAILVALQTLYITPGIVVMIGLTIAAYRRYRDAP